MTILAGVFSIASFILAKLLSNILIDVAEMTDIMNASSHSLSAKEVKIEIKGFIKSLGNFDIDLISQSRISLTINLFVSFCRLHHIYRSSLKFYVWMQYKIFSLEVVNVSKSFLVLISQIENKNKKRKKKKKKNV